MCKEIDQGKEFGGGGKAFTIAWHGTVRHGWGGDKGDGPEVRARGRDTLGVSKGLQVAQE